MTTTSASSEGEVEGIKKPRTRSTNRLTPITEVGRRVDAAAVAAKVSRKQIARELGVVPVSFNSTIVRHHLRAAWMPKIAEMVGRSVNYLLTGEDERDVLVDVRAAHAQVLEHVQRIEGFRPPPNVQAHLSAIRRMLAEVSG